MTAKDRKHPLSDDLSSDPHTIGLVYLVEDRILLYTLSPIQLWLLLPIVPLRKVGRSSLGNYHRSIPWENVHLDRKVNQQAGGQYTCWTVISVGHNKKEGMIRTVEVTQLKPSLPNLGYCLENKGCISA